MEREQFNPVVLGLGQNPVKPDDALTFDPAAIRSTDGWEPVVIALS